MRRRPIRWAIEPLRRYAAFSGRSCRSEFWWFWLLMVVLDAVLTRMAHAAAVPLHNLLLPVAFLIPLLAVCTRRLHDIGRTAWWLLMPPAAAFASLVGVALAALYGGLLLGIYPLVADLLPLLVILATLFVLFGWFCKAGTAGSNLYGPDPLEPGADLAEVFR